jgi:GDP-L-fucose synthase
MTPKRREHINVSTGQDLTIRELAQMIRDFEHPGAMLTCDASKPDGPPQKLLNVSRLHALGWRYRLALRQGLELTYQWFLEYHAALRVG